MDLQICVTLVAVYSFSSAAEEGALNTPASETIDEYLNRWSDWRAANSVQGFGGVASVTIGRCNLPRPVAIGCQSAANAPPMHDQK